MQFWPIKLLFLEILMAQSKLNAHQEQLRTADYIEFAFMSEAAKLSNFSYWDKSRKSSRSGRGNNPVLETLLLEYLEFHYPDQTFKNFLFVGAKRQKLYVLKNRRIVREFPISTSKNGVGNDKGSMQTPLGLHQIRAKIGEDVPIGGIFKFKKYTGKIAEIIREPISIDTDDITTRILTLKGLEEGLNRGGKSDTYARGIYIHGTPEEGLIGTAASHGCVRMKNNDIAELFELVSNGTLVIVLPN